MFEIHIALVVTDLYTIFMDISKIIVPTFAAIIVLWFQLERNKRLQAEGTFFNLLNSIRNLVENTKGKITPLKDPNMALGNLENERHNGLDYFYHANQELHIRLMRGLGETMVFEFTNTTTPSQEDKEKIYQKAIDTYNIFFDAHLPELSHYFRFTYNVISFIDRHENITKKRKEQYIRFIQAQMSDSELQLLFYNGIGKHGENFKKLIEKYNFLQNVNSKGLIEFLKNFYPKSSFRS